MGPKSGKISKACESCRRRKLRCNGSQPCATCSQNPSTCTYRKTARVRKSKSQHQATSSIEPRSQGTPASTIEKENGLQPNPPAGSHPEVYHSVVATHRSGSATSQLFYGPSSVFAFLQQIHRGLLKHQPPPQRQDHDVQDGAAGLDMFMQRSVFFGYPPKVDHALIQYPAVITMPALSRQQAATFVHHFKVVSHHILPFFTDTDFQDMLREYCTNFIGTGGSHHCMPITLAVLARGALGTGDTDLAEHIFVKAKQEAAMFEEAVTLPMIQFSILLADYQLHMARPNSAYLHLGVACRKALAMGLHKEAASQYCGEKDLQLRRASIWCLYFHERWQSAALGRKSAISFRDILCPLPEDKPILTGLCNLAKVIEEGAEKLYGQRANSLWQLYTIAEKAHTRLCEFADELEIGSASVARHQDALDEVPSLQLHNLFYHSVILLWRPFLIARSVSGIKIQDEDVWLRKACRYAIEAAQDSIIFANNKIKSSDVCKSLRYNAFFLDSACTVLLHDILRSPPNYLNHLEYIKFALECLTTMVQEEPILTSRNSIQEILKAVEHSISTTSNPTSTTANSTKPGTVNEYSSSNIQFPPFERTSSTAAEELIYISDRHIPLSSDFQFALSNRDGDAATAIDEQDYPTIPDLYPYLNFDVLTTDLSNFIPADIINPAD